MQPRNPLVRVLLVGVLLAAFSLSCKLVDRVQELRAAATDISSMRTDVDLGGLATQMQGLATEVDMNAVSTQLGGVMTQMPGVMTQMPGVLTQMPGVLTQMPGMMTDMPGLMTGMPTFDVDIPGLIGTPQPTPQGFPSDIPMMTGTILSVEGDPSRLEYSVDADVSAAVEFYRSAMAAQGWLEMAGGTQDTEQARMNFQKGNRIARISIEQDFFFGVVIKISVEG
jgi:hypothetical protein